MSGDQEHCDSSGTVPNTVVYTVHQCLLGCFDRFVRIHMSNGKKSESKNPVEESYKFPV